MPVGRLAGEVDFEGWRTAARSLRASGARPEDVVWSVGPGNSGFEDASSPPDGLEAAGFAAPRAFVDLARMVICHRHPSRFALLYRLLYRLRGHAELLEVFADPDVSEALNMARQVEKSSHRMKAFVRFRRVGSQMGDVHLAWFAPEHRVLERTLPFFVERFAGLPFAILTPDACAHSDGAGLRITPGIDRGVGPERADLEDLWRAG